VWLAHDELLQHDVALKILAPDVAADVDVVERLRREAVLARRVSHPAVCRIHDLVISDAATFLVMQFVEGRPLAEVLRAGALPVAEAVALLAEIGRAVAAMHAVGVVHRDLKPHNVIVRDEGGVVVVDLGVARATDLPALTMSGVIVGTRAYIAPELWQGAPSSPLSDVFSLGVILYQALTATKPWAAAPRPGMSDAEATQSPELLPPSSRVPTIPAWLDAVVLRAIAPHPKDRFPSARALVGALEAGAASLVSLPQPTPHVDEASAPYVIAEEDPSLSDVSRRSLSGAASNATVRAPSGTQSGKSSGTPSGTPSTSVTASSHAPLPALLSPSPPHADQHPRRSPRGLLAAVLAAAFCIGGVVVVAPSSLSSSSPSPSPSPSSSPSSSSSSSSSTSSSLSSSSSSSSSPSSSSPSSSSLSSSSSSSIRRHRPSSSSSSLSSSSVRRHRRRHRRRRRHRCRHHRRRRHRRRHYNRRHRPFVVVIVVVVIVIVIVVVIVVVVVIVIVVVILVVGVRSTS
jgi:serine/threonine protein kinase